MQIQLDLVQFGILFFQFLNLVVASPTDQHPTQQVLAPDALLTDFEASPISTLDIVLDKNCAAKAEIVTTEFKRAVAFARIVSTRFNKDNPYVQAFWPQKFWGSPILAPDYLVYGGEYFKHVVQMGSENGKGLYPAPIPKLTVTCDQTPTCASGNVVAHTDSIKGEINLCNLWDQLPDSNNVVCEDGKQLSRYESKARAIVHELTHLKLSPSFEKYAAPADDVKDKSVPPNYAYGIPACVSLAAGTWGNPAVPWPAALENADNWAWIAAGTAWLELCKKATGNLDFRLPVQ